MMKSIQKSISPQAVGIQLSHVSAMTTNSTECMESRNKGSGETAALIKQDVDKGKLPLPTTIRSKDAEPLAMTYAWNDFLPLAFYIISK